MTGPPQPPEQEPMGDEDAHVWARLKALEEIAERLAATSADPVATADFWLWKAGK